MLASHLISTKMYMSQTPLNRKTKHSVASLSPEIAILCAPNSLYKYPEVGKMTNSLSMNQGISFTSSIICYSIVKLLLN